MLLPDGQHPLESQGAPIAAIAGIEHALDRFGMTRAEFDSYLEPGENFVGLGQGGSESLVLFLDSPVYGQIVRKICAEELSSVDWNPNGTGVMSPPSTKGRHQVEYLQGLPDPVKPYYPRVFNVREHEEPLGDGSGTVRRRLVYDQSRLTGVEASTFVFAHRPTPTVVAHLHHEIMRCLAEKVHPHRRSENLESTIEPSYLSKIEARLELSRSAAPHLFTPLITGDRIYINGRPYKNIDELLAFFRDPAVSELLEPKYHSLVMGDSNTENVMITDPSALERAMNEDPTGFTYDDIGIRFLDPRAIGFESTGADTRDDRMYDNKPVHNTVGRYDVMHGEFFDISLEDVKGTPYVTYAERKGNPYSSPYEGMKVFFDYIMCGWKVHSEQFRHEDPNWLIRFAFTMGTHFAAMPPFHFKKGPDGVVTDSVEMQKRAVAIYCEGIRWLNTAHDMIIGQRRELFGMPVPVPVRSAREATKWGSSPLLDPVSRPIIRV